MKQSWNSQGRSIEGYFFTFIKSCMYVLHTVLLSLSSHMYINQLIILTYYSFFRQPHMPDLYSKPGEAMIPVADDSIASRYLL